jgi:hypothetical protein
VDGERFVFHNLPAPPIRTVEITHTTVPPQTYRKSEHVNLFSIIVKVRQLTQLRGVVCAGR